MNEEVIERIARAWYESDKQHVYGKDNVSKWDWDKDHLDRSAYIEAVTRISPALDTYVVDALTEAMHPEFGYEWHEPDGIIYRAVRDAKAEAWDAGYRSGHSNAMRQMSDEPDAPKTPNPHGTEA